MVEVGIRVEVTGCGEDGICKTLHFTKAIKAPDPTMATFVILKTGQGFLSRLKAERGVLMVLTFIFDPSAPWKLTPVESLKFIRPGFEGSSFMVCGG